MERDLALGFLGQLGGASGAHAPGADVHGPMDGSPVAGATALGTAALSRGTWRWMLPPGRWGDNQDGGMTGSAGFDGGPLDRGLLSKGRRREPAAGG